MTIKPILALYRNFIVLWLSTLLMMSAAPIIVLSGGLIGHLLSPIEQLSTLPIGAMLFGVAAGAIPVSIVFRWVGYKKGFILAGFWSLLGCMLAAWAIYFKSFALFCLATFVVGNNLAFVQQARFCCLLDIPKKHQNVAASLFLTSGVAVAFIGPYVATLFDNVIAGSPFMGSYLAQAVLLLLSILFLLAYKSSSSESLNTSNHATVATSVLRRLFFYYPMCMGLMANAFKTFVFSGMPLGMRAYYNFDIDQIAFVVQMHLLAMFIPSFFTGFLINKFGTFVVILMGAGCLFLSVIVALSGVMYGHFIFVAIFLGFGWNFMFVSATVLLVRMNVSSNLLSLQARNDFFIFFGQALLSFVAGWVLFLFGWDMLNTVVIIPLLMAVVWTFFVKYKHGP